MKARKSAAAVAIIVVGAVGLYLLWRPRSRLIEVQGGASEAAFSYKPYAELLAAHVDEKGFVGHSETERAVLNFLSRYLSENDRNYLSSERYEIGYLDYDWSLNEQRN